MHVPTPVAVLYTHWNPNLRLTFWQSCKRKPANRNWPCVRFVWVNIMQKSYTLAAVVRVIHQPVGFIIIIFSLKKIQPYRDVKTYIHNNNICYLMLLYVPAASYR